jgi:hypothetical protein
MNIAEQIISQDADMAIVLADAQRKAWDNSGVLPHNRVVYHFEDGSRMTFQLDERNQPAIARAGEW